MEGRRIVALGSVLAGLGVVFGAFGAHGLRGRLSPDLLEVFEVAARYQLYHAIALVLAGLLAMVGAQSRGAARDDGTGAAAASGATRMPNRPHRPTSHAPSPPTTSWVKRTC